MKTVIGFFSAALMLLASSTSYGQWDDYNNNCASWTFDLSVKILDRPGDDNNVALISNTLTNATLFSSNQATDLDVGVGIEGSFKRKIDPTQTFEIEFSMAEWDANERFVGPNLQTPFLPGLSPDQIFYNYESSLFSIEFNHRKKTRPAMTLLCGPRFVYLRERVVNNSDVTIPNPPFGTVNLDIRSEVLTKNPMIGGHIGVEFDVQVTRDIFIHQYCKAGVFGNNAGVKRQTDTNFVPGSPSETRKTFGAFIGEVGGRIHYDIFPNVLSCFAGYEATWMDGVALGPPQLLNPTGPINTAPTPFFHGAIFGVQARY